MKIQQMDSAALRRISELQPASDLVCWSEKKFSLTVPHLKCPPGCLSALVEQQRPGTLRSFDSVSVESRLKLKMVIAAL
ncbi:MAG: hypothetical protein JO066_11120 [Verrucomicrobia bacterium]|nr:hypothetical protein [Verrucomicrobiota bacterium]